MSFVAVGERERKRDKENKMYPKFNMKNLERRKMLTRLYRSHYKCVFSSFRRITFHLAISIILVYVKEIIYL